MNDDLNISIVLAEIDKFVSTANESLDQNKKIDLSKIAQYVKNLKCINRIIGIGGSNYSEYFQFGISDEVKKEIEDLISQRTEAKKSKNFVLSDEIRDQLKNMNVQIMDTINGVEWERVE